MRVDDYVVGAWLLLDAITISERFDGCREDQIGLCFPV